MNSDLARFQDAFAQAALAPIDATLPEDLRALVNQPGFSVYRNTVLRGCVDALRANYPAVAALVGEVWFHAVAVRYARAYPPRDSRMLIYGEDFAVFLQTFLRDVATADDLPYLPGVACLDRLWREAHGAADADVLDAAAMTALPLEALGTLVLVLHPAARWRWFDDQPIYTLWSRNRRDGGGVDEGRDAEIARFSRTSGGAGADGFDPASEAAETGDELQWIGEGALLTRPNGAVIRTALDRGGCAFLDACASGRPLTEAVDHTMASAADTDLEHLMAQLIPAGAFSRAQLPDTLHTRLLSPVSD